MVKSLLNNSNILLNISSEIPHHIFFANFWLKLVLGVLSLLFLVFHLYYSKNKDVKKLHFIIKNRLLYISIISFNLLLWLYSIIYESFFNSWEHFNKNIIDNTYIERLLITTIIIIISIAFLSKPRRTNFKKIISHIVSNDLFYPLLFFSIVFVAEKIISQWHDIISNVHLFFIADEVKLPIDWKLVSYTSVILLISIVQIKKHVKAKGFSFDSFLDNLSFIALLFFPCLIEEFFQFTFELFLILITTTIYLRLKNINENKKEKLNETMQWDSYTDVLKGANEMISLNTDEIAHFATPRGLRYLTEQLVAANYNSISFSLRQYLKENSRINRNDISTKLNSSYSINSKVNEIIDLISHLNLTDIKFDKEINNLKIELFKNNNAKFTRFFVIEQAKKKEELKSIDIVSLLSKETDLTDEHRIFHSIYVLHKLFNIDIYLIPKEEIYQFISKSKLVNFQKIKRRNEINRKWNTNKSENYRFKRLLHWSIKKLNLCYYLQVILDEKYLNDAIRNLGINKIKTNGTFNYYEALPKKDGTFIFQQIDDVRKVYFNKIEEKFKNEEYRLENLIIEDKHEN